MLFAMRLGGAQGGGKDGWTTTTTLEFRDVIALNFLLACSGTDRE